MSAGRDDASSIRGRASQPPPLGTCPAHERERARRPAAGDGRPHRRRRAASAPTSTSGPTRRRRASGSPSAPPGTVGPRRHGRSTRPTCSPSPRRCAATGRARASTARSSSGATRTRSPSPPRGPSPRCSARTASRSWSTRTTATRRRPPSRTRSSPTTAPTTTRPPTASSSPRRTTRPQDGGVKYNPPHGGPADTDVTGWIQREANALLETTCATSSAAPSRARCARHDYVSAYVDDLAAVIDLERIRDSGPAPRRRPARRRRASPTGPRSPSATAST